MWEHLAPEDQLCLLLARRELNPVVRQRTLALLECSLHWRRFLECARTHQLSPLLYCSLRTFDLFRFVPEPVGVELARSYQDNAFRNVLLAQELGRVLSLLGEAAVPVMPLKGTALGESLYGDAALRVCSDIDILVPTKHIPHAFHLLLASGYQASFSRSSILHLLARYGKDCSLMRQDRRYAYPLQLHCGMIWGGPTERELLEQVWSTAERRTFYGVAALSLTADWEFLYLATHAARHGFFPLKWLVDLDRFCSMRTANWEDIQRQARLLGWEEEVQSSLSVCNALFDTSIHPAFVVKKCDLPKTFHVLAFSPLEIPREVLFSARLLQTRSQKIGYLAIRVLVPTPADCRFISLPDGLSFLYYVFRPLRVMCMLAWWCVQAGWKALCRFLGARSAAE